RTSVYVEEFDRLQQVPARLAQGPFHRASWDRFSYDEGQVDVRRRVPADRSCLLGPTWNPLTVQEHPDVQIEPTDPTWPPVRVQQAELPDEVRVEFADDSQRRWVLDESVLVGL